MKLRSHTAGAITLAATLLITLLGTIGSSAAAEQPTIISATFATQAEPLIPASRPLDIDAQPVTQVDGAIPSAPTAPSPTQPAQGAPVAASSLQQLVTAQADTSEPSRELKCLAGAIYFEARSESLEGQLAVGRVIIARTRSGRFPASYCAVVYQPSQFSFIRGQAMPSVDAQSHLWQRAVALARIADAGSWQSSAEGALFFHAARVSGNGRMTRIAQIDHHIFYR